MDQTDHEELQVDGTLHWQWLTVFPSGGKCNSGAYPHASHTEPQSVDNPATAWLPAHYSRSLKKSHQGQGYVAALYSSTHTLLRVNFWVFTNQVLQNSTEDY